MNELYHDETRMLSGIEFCLVMLFLLALSIFYAYCLITQKEGSDLYLPPVAAVIILVLIVALLAAALFMKCKIAIDEEGIKISVFGTRTVKFSEIESCETVGVLAVRQFGGWGIRWLPKKIGYIIPGMDAVKLKCKNGKTVVICSENPEKLKEIIDSRLKA